MRAQHARRLATVSAVGILMAGGAAIGTAGPAAAAPTVHTHVTTDWCGDWGDWNGRCFDHHRFDHHGFRFDHHGFRFDHHHFFFNRGGVIIIVL
ncbi:hypothetical protein AQI88_27840 [Streptomyces cellostaticus]|uniref:Uncharacterized protein n=1 Tax=Streptomyces cellostaticus TaxID=67285 RepID=A0A101NH53_9ACTN|nr:hypothetical protein [Streptomyces cellostaticus]KUM93193.1 hypothetical protein AQI88_27840 [Streptomyces cellostaticus]GHI09560.1 hypothetical protein Scel_78810 [Streptomyces cellostaticus]